VHSITSSAAEPAKEEASRTEFDEDLAHLHLALVDTSQPGVPREPNRRALYDPPAWLCPETAGARFALDDLQLQSPCCWHHSASSLPRYAASAQIFLSLGTSGASPARSLRAPGGSARSADVTKMAMGKPRVSMNTCRLQPFQVPQFTWRCSLGQGHRRLARSAASWPMPSGARGVRPGDVPATGLSPQLGAAPRCGRT
jgi:hypothetical protein